MTTPNYSFSQQAYSQAVGTNPTNYPIISTRDPNQYDVVYKIGQFWLNTQNVSLWYLNNQSNASGQLLSTWIQISEGNHVLQSLSDTANTVVYPSSDTSSPPNNIQLVGQNGIIITSVPASNLINFTISNFTPFAYVQVTGPTTYNPRRWTRTAAPAIRVLPNVPVRVRSRCPWRTPTTGGVASSSSGLRRP